MRPQEEVKNVVRTAVEEAAWAPSTHNTQPWSFVVSGEEISLRADADRKLTVSDPAGREMLVSCGAALFTIRAALRGLGCEPVVRVLPDPDRPALVAIVRLGGAVVADDHDRRLRAEIGRRRTHRGDFSTLPVPRSLMDALCREAETEGIRLTPMPSESAVHTIAALTQAAQEVQSQDQAFSRELMRWSRAPGSARRDGVPADAYPRGPGEAYPAFAQRDYRWGQEWGYDRPLSQVMPASPGEVAVLTTSGDSREDWVAAGQALQRVLLFASAYGVSAAFHTQALEKEHLREFLRQEVCSGEYPQMVMRLGITFDEARAMRRPLEEIFEKRP